jgi:hypothetical protein
MAREEQWIPKVTIVYLTFVPAVVIFAILAVSIGGSDDGNTGTLAAPATTGQADAASQTEVENLREQYRECMKALGADVERRPPIRSRFRLPGPDMSKYRQASGVCRAVLEQGAGKPPPTERAPTGPPVA